MKAEYPMRFDRLFIACQEQGIPIEPDFAEKLAALMAENGAQVATKLPLSVKSRNRGGE